MTEDTNRTRLYLAVAGAVLALLFLFAYVLPRSRASQVLEEKIAAVQSSQGEILRLLPEASQAKITAPRPDPDVTTWINQNTLGGLERRLQSNNPYGNGRGAEIKLRSLTPQEVATFLGSLAAVNLVVKQLILEDLGSRGVWELHLFVEIPEGTK